MNVSNTKLLAQDEANTGNGHRVNGSYLVDRRMGYVPDDHEQSMRGTTNIIPEIPLLPAMESEREGGQQR